MEVYFVFYNDEVICGCFNCFYEEIKDKESC